MIAQHSATSGGAPGGALSLQRRRFAERFVEHGNATQAATEAGYSPGSARFTAARLLRDPAVSEYIAHVREALAGRQTAESMERIQNVRRWWALVITGQELPDAAPADRIRASGLLAKSLGAFTKKVEATVEVRVVYDHCEDI